MSNETLLFVQEKGKKKATARLLFVPTKVVSVTSANGVTVFGEGRDYIRKPNSGTLTLTPHSRIAFKTWTQLHPAKGSPMSLGEAVGGKTSLFFDNEGAVMQELQVAVTYDHEQRWDGYTPRPAGKELARTMAKLNAKMPLKLVAFGDSISVGAGASESFHAAPFQPPYIGLVVDGLHAQYGAEVALKNLSEGGQDSTWGAANANKIAEQEPDLVILAFGMNDASRKISGVAFEQNIQKIIATIRQISPNADFLLVATMTGNLEWDQTSLDLYKQYRDVLSGMVGPGVALADETSMWQSMLKTKKFLDLSANGLNHPNDFGHRVYAQVILQALQ